eukprot:9578654-Prorocentrum_lima.AAC.1
MGRNITSIQDKVTYEALTLPGHFIQSPYYVHAMQVWSAIDGNKSDHKKGYMSARVNAMSIKAMLVKIGD